MKWNGSVENKVCATITQVKRVTTIAQQEAAWAQIGKQSCEMQISEFYRFI